MIRRLVLFDIDGTLLHTHGAGRRAIYAALDAVVGPRQIREVRFDGKTDPEIVSELLEGAGCADLDDPVMIDSILARYVTHLEADLSRPKRPATVLPGVENLLDRLEADSSVAVGLLTGNVQAGAALKLKAAGLVPERFRVGAYGSDHAMRSALPAIAARRAEPLFGRIPTGSEVVIIGDTPADVTCGAGIGARAIAVTTGWYEAEVLAQAGAYAVFESLEATDRVCEAILC